MSRETVGIFGSAFNPPSLGHFDVIQQAINRFDRILLVPSAAHAFAKEMISFHHRTEMLSLFVADALASMDIAPERTAYCPLEICTIEAELFAQQPDKPVYTFDLLVQLQKARPESELTYIRGPDNAVPETWCLYYKSTEIEQRWQLFTAEQRVDIRSTYIRNLLSVKQSDDNPERLIAKLLFPSVYHYINKKGLYQMQAEL